MRSFFKSFFATLLAMVVFTILGVFVIVGIVASAASADKPDIGIKGVLLLDLSSAFKEQSVDNPLALFTGGEAMDAPSLYDVIRMIQYAKSDSAIKGIYIACSNNANGYAASEELRKAIVDFKRSKKFVLAYGETISQKGYYIGSAANKIYCHPQGGLEFDGFSSNMMYLKGLLDKLEIQPQIFYAGKFKSATEPLRSTQMSDANRLQTSVWMGDLYAQFLQSIAVTRQLDSAKLRQLAVAGAIQTAHDAVANELLDGLKYDDELKAEINRRLLNEANSKINFVHFSDYAKAANFKQDGNKKIAVVYAAGDIVGGKGDNESVGSDAFRALLQKLRLDDDIKAIVFRVNSPGGSSLASDVIWREVSLTKKVKPVIVSMGDVAASGGYYIACNADSVFANANTITGSIGVFSIIPNFQSFFKNKLGISFDGVKTAPYADMGGTDRPLNETEKRFVQNSVDSIYNTFKSRVAAGRKKNMDYVDSIAQGRVWTGTRGMGIGLVDRIGTMQDAIDCAVKMAKLSSYRIKEYPEKKNMIEELLENYKKSIKTNIIKEEIGEKEYKILQQVKQLKNTIGEPQSRLPFMVDTH
ncbi:MAG: signal peptide peptidase SppA [Bacteroidetes bacterium]|nr:signal peptide peptidase SppA [Bacteroidota bacterium]